MSSELRRLAYLDALGVTAWQPRRGGGGGQDDHLEGAQVALDQSASDAAFAEQPVGENPASVSEEIAGMGWSALESAIASCQRCPLHRERTQGVMGVGNPNADWLLIGEAPGAEEDRLGEPFVGRAGQLLDAMLQAVGQSRERVYIANIIKSRPPGNRDPQPEEIQACLPYLHRQIQLIAPRLIMLVGRVSAQTLLDTSAPVGRLRGQVHRLPGSGIPAVVTYHPAYLLRSPLEKRKVWEDLRLAQRTLNNSPAMAGRKQG